MATIIVFGVPEGYGYLGALCDELRFETTEIAELDLKMDQIVVWFPKDHMQNGLGEEFSVLVVGLVGRPELSEESKHDARKRLNAQLAMALRRIFPKAIFIEVIVAPFAEANGWLVTRLAG